jgi:hypothetical protein
MTSSALPIELLNELCALLPEPDAETIRRMPTDDLVTYLDAYAAARRAAVELPRDVRRAFADRLIEEIEVELAPEGRESGV